MRPGERVGRGLVRVEGRGHHFFAEETVMISLSNRCHPKYRAGPIDARRVRDTSSPPSSLRWRLADRAARSRRRARSSPPPRDGARRNAFVRRAPSIEMQRRDVKGRRPRRRGGSARGRARGRVGARAARSRARVGCADTGGVETGVLRGSRRVRLVGPPRDGPVRPGRVLPLPDRAQRAAVARRRRRGRTPGPPPIRDPWCVASALVAMLRWRDRAPPGGALGTRRASPARARDRGRVRGVLFSAPPRSSPRRRRGATASSRRSSPRWSPPSVLRERPCGGLDRLPLCLLGAVLVVQPTALFGASGRRPPRRRRRRGGRADRLRRNLESRPVRSLSGGVVVSSRVAKSSKSSGAAERSRQRTPIRRAGLGRNTRW